MPLVRRGPGLVGAAARTAVVAGTATAVSGRVRRRQEERYAAQDVQAYEAQAYEPAPAAAAAPAADEGGYAAEIEKLGVEVNGLFNEDDLKAAAEELDPNSSAALLVWENLWARDVAQAMRDAGGVLLDFERLPHEVVQAARDAALAAV